MAMDIIDIDFLNQIDLNWDTGIDDLTLSQVCETLENENLAFEGICDLSLDVKQNDDVTPDPAYGAFRVDMNTDCDVNLPIDNVHVAEEKPRFRTPVTDDELNKLISDNENSNTKNNTKWAVNVFEKWRENRPENIPELQFMNSQEMGHWLERFVVEMRKKDGTEYPPKSVYLVLCGLLRSLRDRGIYDKNFLDEKNTEFAGFRKVANAQMRNLIDKGLGCEVKRADPILPEQEEKLWEKGVFGQENGEQLQLTMFFYACKLFGLRGCDEHHGLTAEQFSIGDDEYGKYIKFVGRTSKTYKGGLGQLNVQNKNIKHYSDLGERCIVDHFDVYLKAIGEGSFYRRPLPPTRDAKIRYSQQNVGVNKLKSFMKVIAEKGELSGHFTNHSGKRTCATQMYIAGVPEQEIMKRTGHRSDAVRKYKDCTSDMLKKVSKVLDPPRKCDVKRPRGLESDESSEPSRKHFKDENESTERESMDTSRVLSTWNDSAIREPFKELGSVPAVFNQCNFNFSLK